jgi:hypothetical protein
MDDLRRHHADIARIADGRCAYPKGRFSGAGIVICAGGRAYFTCAWVLVNVLRALGCRLPIEIWHRGRREMNNAMQGLIESVEGVRCINALEATDHPRSHRLSGWDLKPFAIIHSSFEEVLFIDCDNVPTRDPSFLLEAAPYRRTGAVFWPDRWMGEGDDERCRTIRPEAWTACDVAPRDEPEHETGQMVVDKRRCWRALQLAMFYNEHRRLYYRVMLGDKDTFHMAWRRVGQDYAMPMHRPAQDEENGPVIYQHDFEGRRLFQHRNQDKWEYDGGNRRIANFEHEALCFRFLDELRRRWDGVVRRFPQDYSPAERDAHSRITRARLLRYSHGSSSRLLEFRPDFQIGLGRDRWETHWEVEEVAPGEVHLIILNAMGKMCVLSENGAGAWAGRCLQFERKPIVVEPTDVLPEEQRGIADAIRRVLPSLTEEDGVAEEMMAVRTFLYHRVGHDARLMEFRTDHTIGDGAAGCERWWYVEDTPAGPHLVICGDDGPTCKLARGPDGTWSGAWAKFEKMPIALTPAPSEGPPPEIPFYT